MILGAIFSSFFWFNLALKSADKKETIKCSNGTRKSAYSNESEMTEKERFLNRDLSWLEFNARVLDEALDERTPLFERLRFLSIFQGNLDEYFMKRMGSLYSQARLRFRERLLPLLELQHQCFKKDLKGSLQKEGIDICTWKELTDAERTRASHFYQTNIFPVLSPLSVDPGHPFPFLSSLSISLGVLLKLSLLDSHWRQKRL